MKKTYNCDICDSYGDSYYDYAGNTYGYCDSPKCKMIAEAKLVNDAMEHLELNDIGGAMDLFGDECPSLYF